MNRESDLIKEPVRVTVSDPNPGNRRARWIKDRKSLINRNHKFPQTDKTDSGFQDISDSLPKFSNESERTDSPVGYKKWGSSSSGRKLRAGCSLPIGREHDIVIGSGGSSKNLTCSRGEDDDEPPSYLSRQNCIRYSLRHQKSRSRSLSPSSISSASEASQEGCENALNPSSNLLLPNGVGGRKHSVLFSSYDAWNEENIAQSFREMSPTIGSVLEAAWSGEIDVLEELLKDEEILEKIRDGQLRDNEGRTPLHLSAASGHKKAVDCCRLLLSKGADVNGFDNQKATPLSCAASCGSLSVAELLLNHGADVNAGYDYGKTALHWAIQSSSVDCAKKLLEAGAQQNPPAIFSETPLHIAATLGDAESLQLLLDHGADASLCKGTNRSTALHLAAEEGNSGCLKVLLKSGASPEAKDLRGHTALHIAATCDADCVLTLLKAGADPNATDSNGRTPLHCSVSRGSRAAECVRLLVDKGAEIDAQDNFGYTPLHLAAVNESSQCASILLHHGADVTSKTKAGTSALTLLVRKIPDVMRYLVDRLDSAVTVHDHDPGDPDCEIRLDFRAIVPNVEKRHPPLKGKSAQEQSIYFHKPRKETEFLTCLLAAGNKKILAHPLSEAFLTLKWQRVRKFFWASLLFQIALVALFTIFVVEVYLVKCPYRRVHNMSTPTEDSTPTNPGPVINNLPNPPPLMIFRTDGENQTNVGFEPPQNSSKLRIISKREAGFSWVNFTPKFQKKNASTPFKTRKVNRRNNTGGFDRATTKGFLFPDDRTDTVEVSEEDGEDVEIVPVDGACELGIPLTVIWALLVAFAILMAIKEIFQLLQAPLSYVVSSENWGQWALIGSVTLTAWNTPDFHLAYWQYPAAACGIFLAWGLMLLQVGRFPALGLYVQMLGKVAANFGLFIMAYACLLIAFALAFCVLFPEHPPYSSVPLAILKVLTMMVGEVDYEDLFYNEDNSHDPILYPITAHILHGAFVIIVTIVLMNLLVGLAVHDIQGLQKGAKLNRLSRQTALISRLESFIFSKRLQSCLPKSIGSLLQKSALLVPSSYNWSYYFRPNDPRDKRLPKDLQQASLRLAASKHSSRTIRTHPDAKAHPSNYISPTDAAIRRVEQRLDQMQIKIELVLKNLSDQIETVVTLMDEKRSHRTDNE